MVDSVMASLGTCTVEGCGKYGRIARGYCMTHYARWRKHGDPLIVMRKNPNVRGIGDVPAEGVPA